MTRVARLLALAVLALTVGRGSRVRRGRRRAERGRARHARLVRDLEGREGAPSSGRAGSRSGSSSPATRARCSRRRSSPRATRRATCSSASTTTCSRARSTAISSRRTSRAGLDDVDAGYILDHEHRVRRRSTTARCASTTTRRGSPSAAIAPPRVARRPRRSPRYDGLLVVENPATSTPGLAFLLATIARFGEDGWQELLARPARQRRARRRRLGGGVHRAVLRRRREQGRPADRRLVRVEPAGRGHLPHAARRRTRRRRSSSRPCFRQVELAGVLRGARNEEGAREADRLHALEALPGGHPALDVRLPRQPRGGRSRPRSRSYAVVPEDRRSSSRRARSRPTATTGSTSGRGSCSAERAEAAGRSATAVPLAFLALFFVFPLAVDPRARPARGSGDLAVAARRPHRPADARDRLVHGLAGGRLDRADDRRRRSRRRTSSGGSRSPAARSSARSSSSRSSCPRSSSRSRSSRSCRTASNEAGRRSSSPTRSSTSPSSCASSARSGRASTRACPRRPPRSARGPWQRLREVTLPLLAPSLAAAAAIVFLFSFTSFGDRPHPRRSRLRDARDGDLQPGRAALRPAGGRGPLARPARLRRARPSGSRCGSSDALSVAGHLRAGARRAAEAEHAAREGRSWSASLGALAVFLGLPLARSSSARSPSGTATASTRTGR